jgi:N-acetylglucosaminyldiphosphoundecaprenol N-acetyl-beta-D-mannosaminyltransferase
MIRNAEVVSFPVAALSYNRAVDAVLTDLKAGRAGYVCVANVHMVMEAYDDPAFAAVVKGARFTTSDGMPLVWMLQAQGLKEAERVYGPTLTWELCAAAAREGLPIGLYGGTEQSLDDFREVLAERYPNLEVACAISPPFRPLTAEEDAEYTARLRDSGARLIFVGIGCPRQEKWMAAHTAMLPNAMLFGVGAAFDFHSGRVRQSPPVLQRLGLEWACRLAVEPRRLWRRYVIHNPRFVLLALWQLIRDRVGSSASARKVQKTIS